MSSPATTTTGSSRAGSSSTRADGGGGRTAAWPVQRPEVDPWVILDSGGRDRCHGRGRGRAAGRQQPLGVAPFENGQYVRLRNRGRCCGGYLFADESGQGFSTGGHRGMVNTVWCVQVLAEGGGGGGGAVHVVLHGAYGRHLAATPTVADGDEHLYYIANQRHFDTMEDTHLMWRTIPGSRGGRDVVLLNENSSNKVLRALRANGKYRRWNRGVTVKPIDRNKARFSSMMEWEVQVIPTRVQRPPFQGGGAARCFGQRRQDTGEMQISVGVANDDGNFNGLGGEILSVSGRSLIELGNALVRQFGNGYSFRNMSIFIRAGNLGQPFPLLTDLPRRLDAFDVVVFMVGTPGYNRLRFPNIDAA